MNIFRFFANPEKRKSADIDLAEILLSLSARPSAANPDKRIAKILNRCPTRQSILDKVKELCGEPETSRQRYICAVADTRSKLESREKAIKSLELYLAGQPYDEAYKNIHHFRGSKAYTLEEEKRIHLAGMYCNLGKAYEVEHSLKQALISYSKELELTPFDPSAYCRVSSVHVKRNQLTSALNILINAKKSPYYKPIKYQTPSGETINEDTFKKIIDKHILDIEKKQENGYIYTPKKK